MSTEITKDAAYYLLHPDELTSLNDEQLETLAYNHTQPAPQGDNKGADSPASTGKETEKPAAQDEAEPKGDVQSRDGQHVIPYSVLEAAREKANTEAAARQAAEARAAELESQAKDLQAQIEAAKSGKGTQEQAEAAAKQLAESISPEELATMEEDFPVLAKAVRVQMALVTELQGKLAKVEQAEATREESSKDALAKSVQDLIDANPKLAQLQAKDPDGWRAAVALDEQFKADPKLGKLSTAERFEKVVKAFEAAHGEIAVPKVETSKETKPNQGAPKVPVSMREIPGGTPPAVDEAAALAAMSGTQAMAHFSNMTKEQIERQLDQL